MRLYLASSLIFPRSLLVRLFAVCVCGTHLPLVAFLGWAAATGRLDVPGAAIVAGATLLGTIIAVGGVHALLAPIDAAARALNDEEQGGLRAAPGTAGVDLAARLLAALNRAAGATAQRVRSLNRETGVDPLTGVLNRRGLLQRLDMLSDQETTGALALVDMDHFKVVNDMLGHATGDRVLRDFATILSGTVRHTDFVARWGGEEFLVYFRGATEAQAQSVLMRIAERIRNEPLAHLGERPVTFSAGTTAASRRTLDQALRRAEAALYEAKHRGRARILSNAELA